MTVADLILELSTLPSNFVIEAWFTSIDENATYGLSLTRYLVDEISDVGFSDKVVILGLSEPNNENS